MPAVGEFSDVSQEAPLLLREPGEIQIVKNVTQQDEAFEIQRLQKVEGISGTAILGDGRVGVILDPSGLVALARGLTNGVSIERSETVAELPRRSTAGGKFLTFNLAGIFGASLAPYAATYLATKYGLQYVGYYLSAAAVLSLAGLYATRETKNETL